MKATCEMCGQDKPNCGPWKDGSGKRWARSCNHYSGSKWLFYTQGSVQGAST